jgi:hypothetical protein
MWGFRTQSVLTGKLAKKYSISSSSVKSILRVGLGDPDSKKDIVYSYFKFCLIDD